MSKMMVTVLTTNTLYIKSRYGSDATRARPLRASRHPTQFPQRSASIFVWLHTVNIHSTLYFCELFFPSIVRQVYYSLLPMSPPQQTRMVPTLNASQKLLKMCRQTSPITLKCTWRRTGRYSSYLKVLQNGYITNTTNPRITRLIRSEKSSRNTKTHKVNNW